MVTALATILQSSEMLRNSRLADIGNIDAANAYNKHIYVHKSSTNKQNMQKKTSGIEGCLRCEKKLRYPNGEGSKLSTLLTSFVIPNFPYLDFVSKINRHYKVLNIYVYIYIYITYDNHSSNHFCIFETLRNLLNSTKSFKCLNFPAR